MASSTAGSKLPRPSKSRLPVSISSSVTHLATPYAHSVPSPRSTASPSRTRAPNSPAVRPRTVSTNAKSKSSQSTPARVRPSEPSRTRSVAKPPSHLRPKEPEQPTPSKAPAMSIKEAIALKRAEAKKVVAPQNNTFSERGLASVEDTSPPTWAAPHTVDGDSGRLSLRETIERARSSGSLNIASRDLSCLPSALFEIHLSVTPERLSSVPDEPQLPENIPRKTRTNTAWYDQHDLTFLRARNNQIVELQPEISLFGSLKTIDLQNNRLASLPDSLADLTSLVNLDLSHNVLTSLPPHLFSLPALSVLDISHNSLAALPFGIPFDPLTNAPTRSRRSSDFFMASEIPRATRPLPRLTSLDASHNKIVSSAIHHDALPQDIRTLNLMCNPLDNIADLLTALSTLTQLAELRFSGCNIDDTSFPATLLSSANTFPKLTVLDLEETRVSHAAVSEALSGLAQTLDFEAPITDVRTVPMGTLAVVVGKRIVREAWEIEADLHVQRLRERKSAVNLGGARTSGHPQPLPQSASREKSETDTEQGGLLSESALRCVEVEVAAQHTAGDPGIDGTTTVCPRATPSLARHWDSRTFTLTLPPSAGRPVRHRVGAPAEEDILPRATLPLALITTQPFADTLRTLELRGRRAEPAFILPAHNGQPLLPQLETLNLEGCALGDVVTGVEGADDGPLGALAQLFPGLRNLELGYNNFTGAVMVRGVLERLFFMGDGGRVGLRRLGVCGNRIEELHGLREIAEAVFGTQSVDEDGELRRKWTLEELDVRENSIARLPGELGLLPLDCFLVDGNLFRVPPRRVWEREGTKGLLTWLRGRLETQ